MIILQENGWINDVIMEVNIAEEVLHQNVCIRNTEVSQSNVSRDIRYRKQEQPRDVAQKGRTCPWIAAAEGASGPVASAGTNRHRQNLAWELAFPSVQHGKFITLA